MQQQADWLTIFWHGIKYNTGFQISSSFDMKQKLLTHCLYCLIMSATMTCCVSATVTAVNLGFSGQFIEEWLYSWGIAFPIGFAVLLLLSPLYRRVVEILVRWNSKSVWVNKLRLSVAHVLRHQWNKWPENYFGISPFRSSNTVCRAMHSSCQHDERCHRNNESNLSSGLYNSNTIRQGSDNLRLPHLLIHASTDHTPRVQISLVNRPCHEAPPATFIICKDCLWIMAPPDSNETKYLLILAFVTSDEFGYIKDSINAYKP